MYYGICLPKCCTARLLIAKRMRGKGGPLAVLDRDGCVGPTMPGRTAEFGSEKSNSRIMRGDFESANLPFYEPSFLRLLVLPDAANQGDGL